MPQLSGFQWVTIFLAIASIAIGLLALPRLKRSLGRYHSWRVVVKAIRNLEDQIRELKCDVVIGLADGIVPAAIIVTNFRLGEFYFLDAPYAYTNDGRDRVVELYGNLPSLAGKKCLLVDNHIYTGTNLRAAVDYVRGRGAESVVTLVLFKHKVLAHAVEPDIYAYELSARVTKVPWSLSREHETAYYQ